jgi:hypothetical protein
VRTNVNLNVNQIVNQLFAGKKLTLSFDSPESREYFRQRLYKVKKIQDVIADELLGEKKLVLKTKAHFSFDSDNNCIYFLTLWLTDKEPEKTYTLVSLEEGEILDDNKPDGAQVRKDLEETDGESNPKS